ncbi:hypothetical protein ACF061_00940 [Streptomyces sp. NPDC015220]|uniref:hypothetical protein n=1 Tax=Streptomyces sp. NPDC015220 TaxID=3364947 RepID=UPI0036FAD903
MYRLKYDPAAEAVHEAMPPAASEALTLALADACHDPFAVTEPWGVDDGITRMLITPQAFAVLMVGKQEDVITIFQITYLG